MSEHLRLARKALNDGVWKATKEKVRYQHLAIWDLVNAVAALEAQQETPASGLTLHESAGASPEASTTSTPATAITELISSPSALGQLWEEAVFHRTPPQPSRTTGPISSTPSTDRSTGQSVSITNRIRNLPHYTGPGAINLADVLHELAIFALEQAHARSPEAAAPSSGGKSEDELRVGFDSILYWLDSMDQLDKHSQVSGYYRYARDNIQRIATHFSQPMKETRNDRA